MLTKSGVVLGGGFRKGDRRAAPGRVDAEVPHDAVARAILDVRRSWTALENSAKIDPKSRSTAVNSLRTSSRVLAMKTSAEPFTTLHSKSRKSMTGPGIEPGACGLKEPIQLVLTRAARASSAQLVLAG